MKFSSKIEKCGLSPMRKFAPYAAEAVKKGKKVYHLNIGQPDIATPEAYFEAVKNFSQPVLAYAPSDGVPEMIDAVVNYYGKIDAPITNKQVLITTGGSEALQIALSCILDEGDEIIIPEPFYPNYSTFVTLTGATIRPVTTKPEEGYKFAVRERIEAHLYEPVSMLPLVGYLIARQREAAAVRMIMTALENRFPMDRLRERLRDMYGN